MCRRRPGARAAVAPLHDRQAEAVLLEIRADGQRGVCDHAEADEDGEPRHHGPEGRAALVLIVLRGRRVVRASLPPMQWRNVSALIVATYRRPLATAGSPLTLSPKSCDQRILPFLASKA